MRSKPPKLKDKAQALANRYARLRDCTDGVYGGANCISCGVYKDFSQLDGGHFVPTTSSYSRFDERNINAQCTKCNRFLHGNVANYLVGLEAKLGREVVDELLSTQRTSKKWPDSELLEIITYYQEKIGRL